MLITQSCLTLCDPMDCQTPLSMEFSRQEYWSGLPWPSFFRDLPDPGIKSRSPALQADSLLFELLGKPYQTPSPESNKMLQTQLEVSESLPCSGYHHLDFGCLQFPCMFLSLYYILYVCIHKLYLMVLHVLELSINISYFSTQ